MNEIEKLKEQVRGLKVLFVDDEQGMREGIGIFLRKFFDDVVICSDGIEGLETFSKEKDFDIVISDVLMPKMDGVTMVKKIKEINKDIFTVFITASRSMLNEEKELSNLSLKKPISFEDIVMIMNKVVDLK
mgnify:CR=1 FL=1